MPGPTRCLCVLAVTGALACGHSSRATPVALPATTVTSVAWDATARLATCRRTGTTLSVPQPWEVRSVGPHQLMLSSDGSVASVSSAAESPSPAELVRDVIGLHRIVSGVSPVRLHLRQATIDHGELRLRYAVTDDDAQDHRLVYRLILRNGASCQIAVVVPPG